MIQRIGGGRVIDHGPQKPYFGSRTVIGGSSLAAVVVTGSQRENLRGLSALSGHASSLRKKPVEPADARKARYATFKERHGACECHEMIGGQPRPKGYRERERDRSRLRRELRRAGR